MEEKEWFTKLGQIADQTKVNYLNTLPEEESIKSYMRDAFVLLKPISSVGGDGYWMHKEDDWALIAVFDVHGQGHLGSMMTRIYVRALEKLVVNLRLSAPAIILQYLHKEIKSRFTDKNSFQANTGVDIGVIKFDFTQNVLEFSGANINLIQVDKRNLTLHQASVGRLGSFKNPVTEFTTIKLENAKKSSYYLFTDGFSHQIDGQSGKKLGLEEASKILASYSEFSFTIQREKIMDYIAKWTGSFPQTDDILIVGFKP